MKTAIAALGRIYDPHKQGLSIVESKAFNQSLTTAAKAQVLSEGMRLLQCPHFHDSSPEAYRALATQIAIYFSKEIAICRKGPFDM